MLTFYDSNVLMNIYKKINEIVVKKLQFSQNIQNVPKLKFFLMKKPILTTYKPIQKQRLEAMYQNVPLNEINVPYGTLFYQDNSVKLIKLRPSKKTVNLTKTQTVPKMPNKKLKIPT